MEFPNQVHQTRAFYEHICKHKPFDKIGKIVNKITWDNYIYCSRQKWTEDYLDRSTTFLTKRKNSTGIPGGNFNELYYVGIFDGIPSGIYD